MTGTPCAFVSPDDIVAPQHTTQGPLQGLISRQFGQRAWSHVLLVLAVAVIVRAPIFFALDTTTVGWHSADYGSIARNYYRNGFQFFYPQIDWGGDGPGFVEMEFPIVPYATALLYAVAGGVDDRLAVVVPLASGLLAVLFTYLIALELFTPAVALTAGFFAGVSPVFARFSQLAFPEATMLAGSAAAIYAAVIWVRTGRALHLLFSATALSLALLLKPTALILGGPLLWAFWLREGRQWWRRPAIYWYGVVALVPPLLWYAHALGLAREFGNSFGILFGGGSSKLANWDILTTPAFYARIAQRVTVYHLTVGGLVAAVWAVRARWTAPQLMAPIWLASALVSIVVVAEGNFEAAYYQLPIVLPACVIAAVGFAKLDEELTNRAPVRLRAAAAMALTGFVLAAALVGNVLHYQRSDYVPFTLPRKHSAQALATVLEPGALIIYSEHEPLPKPLPRGQHVTPPDPFYFSDHRGWYLATPWVTGAEIANLKQRGARYFIVADIGRLGSAHPDVIAALDRAHPRVETHSSLVAWDLALNAPPSRTGTSD